MGLKEELRARVEIQIPTTVQVAALYASFQEGLMLQSKTPKTNYFHNSYTKTDSKSQLATGDLWKAKQLKVDPHEIISNAVLDALVTGDTEECAAISATALSGAHHPKTIQLMALVGNQVVLILIDSIITRTFVDQALLSRISVAIEKIQVPLQVKVANGQLVQCTEVIPQLTWWLQGHNFSNSMQVFSVTPG